MSFEGHPALGLFIALGIGLLIGAERERRKGTGPHRAAAGVRTFALAGLAGGMSLLIGGELLVAVAAASVAAFSAIAYRRTWSPDPGLTSAMALFATTLLGALAIRQPGLAAALGVAVTILLTVRSALHRFVRDVLSEQEVHDALLFAAASLVILPSMPDRAIGPYGVLNPRRFWELVVLVMGISGGGYIALRSFGSRFGLPLAGLVGGFVSATATIGSMATRALRFPRVAHGCIAGALFSNIATIIQTAIVLIVVNRTAASALAKPLLLGGIATIGYGLLFLLGEARSKKNLDVERGHAFSLKLAFLFAVTLSLVMFVSAAVQQWLGIRGLTLAAGLAGLADAQAPAISVAALVSSGKVTPAESVVPILTGLTTNTLTKAAFAATLGDRKFAVRVYPGLALMILAAWAGLLLR